ncbi:DEAD/DEAH box helicase family protein, partial [Mycolicibacterium iranicum]
RWQDDAGQLILAKRAPEPDDPVAGGLYAADTIVLSIPRQVGKTYLIACIVFALCLIHPGLTVIWTAHRKTTAAETFETFAGMADRSEVKPHIKPGRGGVKRGRGDEKILFRNGSRILFGARENGFGRGFSNVGVIVFDEAQILTEATLEDMGAAQNVAANPLTFMMGTPPRPKDPGEYFETLRQEAIDGEVDDSLYIEFSADRAAAEANPMDDDQIRKANPSYPHRTSKRAMLRLRKKLKSLDSWMREALGVWDEVSVHRAPITESIWRDLLDFGPDLTVAPNALGVDMSHGMDISVGACWLEDDGGAHLEEVWAGTDSLAAIDWIAKAAGRRMEVVIDDLSPAAHMIPTLKAKGVNVRRSHSRDMAKGCLLFETYFKGRKLSHA